MTVRNTLPMGGTQKVYQFIFCVFKGKSLLVLLLGGKSYQIATHLSNTASNVWKTIFSFLYTENVTDVVYVTLYG